MSNNQLEVRHTYISNLEEIAHHIQGALEPILRDPEPGIYLPDQMEPILKEGRDYWYQETVFVNQASRAAPVRSDTPIFGDDRVHYGDVTQPQNQPWQYYRYNYRRVGPLEQVLTTPWDVVEMPQGFYPSYYNADDILSASDKEPVRVLLPAHLAHRAMLKPELPVMGFKIAKQVLENQIASSRAYHRVPALTIEQIVLPFLREECLPPKEGKHSSRELALQEMLADTGIQNRMRGLERVMEYVTTPIALMLGENRYQMFEIRYEGGHQLLIDQLGDYRIHEFERISADPAYQRFVRAQADGSWDRFVDAQDVHQQPTLKDIDDLYK